jgi:hypothetical protein
MRQRLTVSDKRLAYETIGSTICRTPLAMTTKTLLTAVGLLAGFAFSTHAADPSKPSSTIEVNFIEPNKFTDVKDRYSSQDEASEHYLKVLKEHLERTAARRLPPGHRLVVSFTNIDMAGDFEPWRSPQMQDVRIVKDIYPPRIDLNFQLFDPNGEVVAEGQRELRNLTFNMSITTLPTNDPLRHEKALLDDWLRQEFRAKKS